MKKLAFAFIICLLVFAAWKIFEVPPRPSIPGYNVLYLSSDSFNKKHLAMYGYHRNTMPFLEEMSRNALVFEKMINPSGWTNENLVSIFSSLSSPVHKVETRGRNISAEWITPIEILREYGYQVPRLAQWQSDQNHWELGFDTPLEMHPALWLEKHGKDRPFFLFYQFLNAHLPYNNDNRDSTLFLSFFADTLFENPASRKRVLETVFTNSVIKNDGDIRFEPEDRAPIDAFYDGELRVLDAEFETTVAALKRLGLTDKTIIVVGADHGEELLEHGFVGHASTSRKGHLFDEIVNIPFLIYFPKDLGDGRFIHTQVRGIDVLPTLMNLMGIPIPDYLEGRSMIPVIRDEEKSERVAFIQTSRAGYGEPDPENVTDRIRAIRTNEWKLVHYFYKDDPARFELYDLKNDPAELHNVIDSHPAKANELRQQLMDWVLRESKMKPPPPERYMRKSYYQRFLEWWYRKPRRTDFTGVPSPPLILSVKDSDVVTARTFNGSAPLRWDGEADVPYVIEYVVGEGDYRLDGFIENEGNEKIFGPFPDKYWNTYLTLYSPYRIRVSIDKQPREWGPWVMFSVESTD